MRFLFVIVCAVFIQCSDGAINAKTKKIVTLLQNQLTQPTLVDYFKRGGSMDPAISTILQNVPSAEISSFTCFLTNINGAINAARANTGNAFAVVTYYKGVCNSDAKLNAAMEALADPTAQTRLQGVVDKIVKSLPPQLQDIASGITKQAFSGQNITIEEANGYITKVKTLSTTTKQAMFKQIPSLKNVLNKKGPMFQPFNVLLNNLPIVLSNKAPTAAQKKNINAALKKMWGYAYTNANQYINFALKWLKNQPIADSQNEATVLQNYRTGAARIVQLGKPMLAIPSTQDMIQKYFTTPYQLS